MATAPSCPPAGPPARPMLALLIRLGAAAAISTMSLFVKLAGEHGVALPEILFWRQALTLPLVIGWLAATRSLRDVRTQRLGGHARRTIYGVTGMVLNFGAVMLLPLAEATTINFATPIFAVILSVVLLRESVGRWRWAAVALGFVGVLVITASGIAPGAGHIPLAGAAVALGGAFMTAVVSIQLRDLGRTERPLTVVFWFAGFSAPVLALALPFVSTPHDGRTWLLLGALGLSGGIGQLLLTASLRYGSVASVIVMDYSALLWATLYGWAVFAQLPPQSTWAGAPLVVGAGLTIAWREHRLARRAQAQTDLP